MNEQQKRLTAKEVIERLHLDENKWYEHKETGSVDNGVGWLDTFIWLEESGSSEFDAAFDPSNDEQFLFEVPIPFDELAVLLAADRALSFPTTDRCNGSAGPDWMSAATLQDVIESGDIDEYTELEPEDAAEYIGEVMGALDPNHDTLLLSNDIKYRVAERVITKGEYSSPSDYRHYIVLWEDWCKPEESTHDQWLKYIDEKVTWGDEYDGELPELDPDDYDSAESMEQADEQRRKQYWHITGTVASSLSAWNAMLLYYGINEDDAESFLEKNGIPCAGLDMETCGWPVKVHVAYVRGDYTDETDSIEGTGWYDITNL